MYYFLTSVFVLLTLVLLVWACIDIFKTGRNKALILLLLFAPTIGPLIYFQTKR